MARLLHQDFGLAPERIRAETRSRNTREHVPRLKQLLGERRRVLLVTTAWHMPRAMGVFRAHGYDPIAAPTDYRTDPGRPFHPLDLLPSADSLGDSADAFHEYLGIAWYTLRGDMA